MFFSSILEFLNLVCDFLCTFISWQLLLPSNGNRIYFTTCWAMYIVPFGKRRRVPFRIVLPNSGYVSELSPCYEILNTTKNKILIKNLNSLMLNETIYNINLFHPKKFIYLIIKIVSVFDISISASADAATRLI